jgi:hypothetical protein
MNAQRVILSVDLVIYETSDECKFVLVKGRNIEIEVGTKRIGKIVCKTKVLFSY